jgi:DNA-binding winged helix-turn-helix (wHTH) protein
VGVTAVGEPFWLGTHCVTPALNEINGLRIEPKAMDVLVSLAAAAPQVVAPIDLLERVWPNVVVGDSVLHRAIAQLRKALGDDPRSPRYIENVPRRGYRLLVSIERAGGRRRCGGVSMRAGCRSSRP